MHAAATPAEAPQGRSDEPKVEAPPTPPPSTHSGGPKSASPRQTRSTPSRSSSTPSASGSPSSSSRSTPIEPAYFYLGGSGGGGSNGSGSGSGSGSVDDVDAVPVFEPSMDDFRDFYSFCERIDHWGMRSGIVKVVPPAEWTGKLPKLDEGEVKRLRAVRIKNSISQMFSKAGGGAFHQKNIVHPAKVVNAKQWADLCASKEQRGPDMERMKGNARAEAKARKQELRMGHFAVPTDDNDDDDDDEEQKEEDGVRTRSGGSGFKASAQAQAQAQAQPPAPSRETAKHGQKAEGKVKMADRTTEAEWDAFDYENGWCHEAGPKATADDWKDEEVCRAIEKEYWSGLIWGKPPMYGADLEGTLFTDETKDWNVGHLDNVLTRLKLKHRLKGVTTPYLYFGMWRATFAWHVEDVDLYSINYIHFGAPKQWYSIRQSDRQRFELAMAGAFPGDSSRCRHFMRHKSYLASPSFLASNNIKPLRLVQHAGEFVITYPYGYHSGYNLGFNCAESLNFALESWIPIGRRAGHCLCDPDAVHMDIDALLEESAELEEMERRREERQRGQVEHEARLEVRRQRERERRRQRKLEMEQLGQGHKQQQQQHGAALVGGEEEKERQDNCVFCPYNLDDDLVPLRADAKARYAHRFCTNFMPECWVGEDDDDRRGAGEVVMGFDSINKARWSLKCQLCATPQLAKKGAKVQCTYSKCSRTTHAACALKDTSGWLLDVVGDRAADRLEGKTTGTDEIEEDDEEPTRMVVLCKQHNPEQKQREAARKALVLKACVTRLKEGQNVRVRTSRGVWMTVLVEVNMAPQGHDGAGEGTIVTSDGAETPWSRVVFEQEALKEAEAEVERLLKEEEEAKVKLEAEMEREEWHRKTRKEAEEVDKQIAIEQERVQAMKREHNREAQESLAGQILPDETAGAHIDSQMEDEHKKQQPKKRKGPPVQGPWTENGEAPQLIRKPYQKRKKVEASADQPQGLLPASRNVMAVDHMLAGTSASVANAPQLPPPRPISAPEHNAGPMTMVQPGGTAWGPRVLSWHPPSYDLYYQQRRYAEQQRGLALQLPYQPSIQHPSHPQHPPHPQHVHYQPHPKYQTPHLSQQRPLYHHERLPPREQHPQGSTFHQVSAPPRTSMSGPSDMYQEQYPTLPSPAHHRMGDQRQSMTSHHRYSNLTPGAMMADDATGEVPHSPSQRSGHHPEITRDRFSHENSDRATSVHPSYPRQYS